MNNEDSVKLALAEITQLEEQRIKEEKNRFLKQEQEKERIAKEIELKNFTAAEAAKAQKEKEKLRLKYEADAQARLIEQERVLEHELNIKRLESKRKIPKWIYFLAASGIIIIIIVSMYIVQIQQEQAAKELQQLREQFKEKEESLTIALEKSQKAEQKAGLALESAISKGNKQDIATACRQLVKAEEISNSTRRKKAAIKKQKPASTELKDDPIGDFKL